jgi:citrate synthase
MNREFRTRLASNDLHHIWVRNVDLTEDIVGKMSFGHVLFLLVIGRQPDAQESRLVDAVLVSLIEHGLTPSAVVARVTYSLVPESVQGAVAAGLLGVGGVVLGSMEECGHLLYEVNAETRRGVSLQDAIHAVVDDYTASGKRIPGLGHAIHRDGDPRAARLIAVAKECGRYGPYVEAVEELENQAQLAAGRRIPLNVTGVVSAVLLELGIPWSLHRGFALVSRTAGLVAHIGEEIEDPITPRLRSVIRGEVDRLDRS